MGTNPYENNNRITPAARIKFYFASKRIHRYANDYKQRPYRKNRLMICAIILFISFLWAQSPEFAGPMWLIFLGAGIRAYFDVEYLLQPDPVDEMFHAIRDNYN